MKLNRYFDFAYEYYYCFFDTESNSFVMQV